jgi:putative endonuclease
MRDERVYYVFILASESGTLYVGVTSNLEGRLDQHKSRSIKGFTQKYGVKKLLYYEGFDDVYLAITHERKSKSGGEKRKFPCLKSRIQDG